MPNIAGDTITRAWTNSGGVKFVPSAASSGPFQSSTTNYVSMNGGSAYSIAVYEGTFDASRSSSIYGNSSTVQPESIEMCICIKY